MPAAPFLAAVFPAADPIPLPAPVWLFKGLLDLTLTLHFVALYMLLGGMLAAVVLNARGHRAGDAGRVGASGVVAGWLPVVMTYVINLGIPPLLFAQVLYGRALYTSSVLVGAYWIAVIPLLIGCYHLLYVAKARGAEGRPFVLPLTVALLAAWAIARIYTANMTLMLDPAAWGPAYHADPSGGHLLAGPGSWARWAYMLAAGVTGGGVLLVLLSRGRSLTEPAATALRGAAKPALLAGTVGSVAAGIAAWGGQPAAIREACSSADPVWAAAAGAWFLGATGVAILAVRLGTCGCGAKVAALSGSALLQTAGFVVCRDLVRDASLAAAGFDVWDRTVAVNGSVLGLFFVLFVAGLGVIGWLASVAWRAEPAKGEMP
jgi:hypothetical protein